MTKLIDQIFENVPMVKVGYDEFWKWYSDNESNFDELESHFENIQDEDRDLLKDLSKKARNLFLCFQVFYILLKKNNVETITLRRIFLTTKKLLWKFMKSMNERERIEDLSDIFIVKDEKHKNELIKVADEIIEKYLQSKINDMYADEAIYDETKDKLSKDIFPIDQKSLGTAYTDTVFINVSKELTFMMPTVNNLLNKSDFTQAVKTNMIKFLIKVSNTI